MPSELLWLLLPLLWAGSLAQERRYTLTVKRHVTVQEGLCAQVACNLSFTQDGWENSTPAHGYWYLGEAYAPDKVLVATNNSSQKEQEETQGRFHLLGNPKTYSCILDIVDARRSDEGFYFFRVKRRNSAKDSYTKNKLYVRVTTLNHTPSILIPGPLESGRPRNLTCSVPWACERGTPPIFSWMSAAHSSLGPRTRRSSVITLTPRLQDHGTNLTCQVHFPAAGVTVETTIQLNVTCAPQNQTTAGCLGDGTGLLGPVTEMMLVAIVEAAVKALVLLPCLLIFIGRYHRMKSLRPKGGMKDADTVSG